MPLPKFNFIPERQLAKTDSTCLKVSIQKNNQLSFSKDAIDIYDLDGKWIEFFIDTEKKALGWSVFERTDKIDELKKLRQIIKRKTGGCGISIGKLLKALNVEMDIHRPQLEVKKYDSALVEKDIYYVTLE